jgi:putative ABC transport system permease protein
MVTPWIQSASMLFDQARINIQAHKMRAFLAVLGVWIGSASVVALLYCSQLATLSVVNKLSELGTNLISLSLLGSNESVKQINSTVLINLQETIPDIKQVAPIAFSYEPTSFHGQHLDAHLIGSTTTLYSIAHLHMQAGRFFNPWDEADYCVVGAELQQQVGIPLVGSQIRYGNHYCTVLGVLAPTPNNFFIPVELNRAVWFPLASFIKHTPTSSVRDVVFSLHDSYAVEQVERVLKNRLAILAPKTKTYFRNPKTLIEKVVEQKRQLTILLAIIGSISLLVGGIGIMNIMLVSVVERKREIGIRLAVGAHVRDIRWMFLVEAILLSLCGGVLGILCGVGVSLAIAHFVSWPIVWLFMPILLGFVVSVAVGVFFGYWPAHLASSLHPVDALRME